MLHHKILLNILITLHLFVFYSTAYAANYYKCLNKNNELELRDEPCPDDSVNSQIVEIQENSPTLPTQTTAQIQESIKNNMRLSLRYHFGDEFADTFKMVDCQTYSILIVCDDYLFSLQGEFLQKTQKNITEKSPTSPTAIVEEETMPERIKISGYLKDRMRQAIRHKYGNDAADRFNPENCYMTQEKQQKITSCGGYLFNEEGHLID